MPINISIKNWSNFHYKSLVVWFIILLPTFLTVASLTNHPLFPNSLLEVCMWMGCGPNYLSRNYIITGPAAALLPIKISH